MNGHHGDAFTPLNGVKQGCPLSPLLYILSLQPLLASLEEDLAATSTFVVCCTYFVFFGISLNNLYVEGPSITL